MDNSVIVRLQYTKKQIDNRFVKTGKRVDTENRSLSTDEMTTAQRTDLLVIDWHGNSRYGSQINHYRLSAKWFTKEPCVGNGDTIKFDHVPTDAELLKLMAELANEKRQVQAEVAELLPVWRIEFIARKEEEARQKQNREEDREHEAERKEAKRKQKRAAAIIINWQEDGTAIHDLKEAVEIIGGLDYDHRWNAWIKTITDIDRNSENGYMFEGDWINSGTVELVKGERQLFLVAAESGSRKYRTCYYTVVELTTAGLLIKHDIDDNDDKRGWALRMRADVEALLI